MNAVRKLEYQHEVYQETGTVIRIDESSFYVRAAGGNYLAQKAVSCLVEPQVDDLVLVACQANGQAYILAILERNSYVPTCISVTGDFNIQVAHGRFSVSSAQGLDFMSASELSLTSPELQVHTQKANVFMEHLSYLGQRFYGEVERMKTVAVTVDSFIQRVSQKIKRSYRTVEEMDHVRAEQIDYHAEKNMNLHGKNALITANDLVKVDGDQIHLG